MRYIRPIAVVGAYGVLAWSVPTAVYQPLPPLPGWLFWVAAVAATVAAGLIWGSWWAALVGLVPLAVWVNQGPLAIFVAAIAVVPIACLTLAGVWAARRLGGRAAIAGAVVLGAAFTPWVASAALHRWPPDHTPAHPAPIDLQRGAYRGVALGDSRATVIAHLGSPSGPSSFAALHHLDGAAGADAYGSMRLPDEFLVYRDTAVLVTDDRVVAIITSSSSAQTLRGIGPGDGLALVASRYPALRCEDHDSYADSGPGGPPDCHGVIGSTRVWISQDPVQIVTVASRAAGLGF
jgi:hypothetical protein